MNDRPVWFVEKDGNFIDIIQLDQPDTWGYRREARKYPDCNVWTRNLLGWCVMRTNYIATAIWKPDTPPNTIKMAAMLGD